MAHKTLRVEPQRLVIVTDRRLARDLPAQLEGMLAAIPRHGAIVQVREKDLAGAALLALVRDVVAVAHRYETIVLVNDRLDVALAAGADGVHLPEDGMTIAEARQVAGRRIVLACSRHSREGVLAADREGAHVILLGPIFATPSKAAYGPPLGVSALEGLVDEMRDACLYAIGGIETAEQAAACRAAGADGVAAIRALWTAADPGAAARALYGEPQGE